MLWHHEVEPGFRRLFDEQWRLSRRGAAGQRQDDADHRDWLDEAFEDAAEAACCPVAWLMPDLMGLIARTTNQPLDRVRIEVRALLTEQDFNAMSGDTIHDTRRGELIDVYVDRLTRTIERIRRHTAKSDVNAPADPSCFFG